MLQKLLQWVREVIRNMLSTAEVKSATGVEIPLSNEMVAAMEQWERMYQNQPEWASKTVQPIGLPAAISSEMARLVTLELKTEVSGNDWLNEQYQRVLVNLKEKIEQGLALGGLAFKPYPTDDGTLGIDIVSADRFFPRDFDSSGNTHGGVFVDRVTRGRKYYTRFESHELSGTSYTIRNVAYASDSPSDRGTRVSLDAVPQWAELAEEIVIQNVKQPLFGFFRVPLANTIDRESPMGVSIYARAVGQIREADEQWARLMWEFEGTQLALDVSESAFLRNPQTGKAMLPKGKERLFRALGLGSPEQPLYQVFSPQIREEPLYRGFQHILQRIEFDCGLAYGTLSDPQTVEKTAEEIKSSKQRSYATVSTIQKALEYALRDLLYAMNTMAQIYKLSPTRKYDVSFTWDDSIVVDSDKEFAQRMQMVSQGMLKPELFLSWWYGCSEEEARGMMPTDTGADPFGLNHAES